jgi:acetyl-CoA carboxylase biotin carboxylase subunit
MAIRRLLVANRGEIALRIIRACREMSIESVSVYSAVDAHAPHALAADMAVPIGPAPAADSYLSIPKLVDAAKSTGCDAVHPGYGFLAENAAFAAACGNAGLTFVGPPPALIELMGSKTAAREAARSAGLPIVPGATASGQSTLAIKHAASDVGFPVLLKATAGGGGKGMRLVAAADNLDEAIDAARREAQAAFGDGTLYVERAIERPRHVEIQVFGDAHGHAVHLFERDCSVQRRHQKVIEESPSPALTPALRDRMGTAAASLVRAVGYRNAGTVEFLLEGTGDEARFFFLEMNTRLQVEHPVTEAVTGVDLVRAQLLEAAGEPLPWTQEQLSLRGHAIECRVYAEDPAQGFIPQAGRLLSYREPVMPGIRIDSGVAPLSNVSVYYDPLLAKLIASGESRAVAIERARAALRDFPILGIRTNVPFLIDVLADSRFRDGDVHTRFLDEEGDRIIEAGRSRQPPDEAFAAAIVLLAGSSTDSAARMDDGAPAPGDPWSTLRGWRN